MGRGIKIEIKDDFLNKLKFCAYARNVAFLPHRTLKEFSWFIDGCIWGQFQKKYPHFTTDWDVMIDTFVKYCEEEYGLKYNDYIKGELK